MEKYGYWIQETLFKKFQIQPNPIRGAKIGPDPYTKQDIKFLTWHKIAAWQRPGRKREKSAEKARRAARYKSNTYDLETNVDGKNNKRFEIATLLFTEIKLLLSRTRKC